MHRNRGRSLSQLQDEEVASIEAHFDYVKRVLKWSISDLDRFINLLKARIAAEETYILSLQKITKQSPGHEIDPTHYFNGVETSFYKATFQYEASINKIISVRVDLIKSLRKEVETLAGDLQEQRRKRVKSVLDEVNTDYTSFRTRDIVKLQKAYSHKCNELQNAQILAQQQQQQLAAQMAAGHGHESEFKDADHLHVSSRMSSDEPRPRLSNESGRDTDASSISSLNNNPTEAIHKKGMGMEGFMAKVRTQIVNAAAAASANSIPVDASKQNLKFAKLKKDISDADLEYRDGIRILERLRKFQIDSANGAMKQIETVLSDKTEATKAVLQSILNTERATISKELMLADNSLREAIAIDSASDLRLFMTDFQKRRFVAPTPIYYENFYYGMCKEILFGSSLEAYAKEHGRTVPLVVTKCIEAVERMGGLQKEGIYRISGRQSNVEMLKHAFEHNEESLVIDSKYDVFTIASVLKIYLREMAQPLFNMAMQNRLEYSHMDEKQRPRMLLQRKLAALSKPHRDTLSAVINHLAKVAAASQVNKMHLQNLSVIFTPAIFHDFNQAENPGEWQSDKVFEDLVLHHESLFKNAEATAAQIPQKGHVSQSSAPAMVGAPSPVVYSPQRQNASAGLLLTSPMQPPIIADSRYADEDSPIITPNQRSSSVSHETLPIAGMMQASGYMPSTTTDTAYPRRSPGTSEKTLVPEPSNKTQSETTESTPSPSVAAPAPCTAPSDGRLSRKSTLRTKGPIPPRQDSLRQKAAQALASTTRAQQPSAPQTPTIAIPQTITPSSAEIQDNPALQDTSPPSPRPSTGNGNDKDKN
ncbi:hypothetical protein EC973_009605 [Apophysomyces ossiformis]|uniref:Rho-GAP domain-containing protein n=1 Tax=Apophysomyces ossiformis TaxID=679940 RepID=A0A8H7EQ78_9FUNG|nr:hypothetical protein EC973_009605 [Apophysomyces ossiformis]